MTTYMMPAEIYSETLSRLVAEWPEEAAVLGRIEATRVAAKAAIDEADRPGFQLPFVSYIPAYGAEDEVQAMADYCDLKRCLDKSSDLCRFIRPLVTRKRSRLEAL